MQPYACKFNQLSIAGALPLKTKKVASLKVLDNSKRCSLNIFRQYFLSHEYINKCVHLRQYNKAIRVKRITHSASFRWHQFQLFCCLRSAQCKHCDFENRFMNSRPCSMIHDMPGVWKRLLLQPDDGLVSRETIAKYYQAWCWRSRKKRKKLEVKMQFTCIRLLTLSTSFVAVSTMACFSFRTFSAALRDFSATAISFSSFARSDLYLFCRP